LLLLASWRTTVSRRIELHRPKHCGILIPGVGKWISLSRNAAPE
jgi:hypothetical protein